MQIFNPSLTPCCPFPESALLAKTTLPTQPPGAPPRLVSRGVKPLTAFGFKVDRPALFPSPHVFIPPTCCVRSTFQGLFMMLLLAYFCYLFSTRRFCQFILSLYTQLAFRQNTSHVDDAFARLRGLLTFHLCISLRFHADS